jgi:hypothetical protein
MLEAIYKHALQANQQIIWAEAFNSNKEEEKEAVHR